jgi:arylsulfatase A-like enzyme/lysophospholipase L1-like esterase
MNPRVLLLALAAATCISLTSARAADAPRPNFVFILADDLGYGDLSCYGATKIKTPNLDRLAREGLRFTDAHTPGSVCSPTRYGLLTGRYAWRGRLKKGVVNTGDPALIEPGRLTLPALLQAHGYRTALIGKWHLGFGSEGQPTDWNQPLRPGPLEAGFGYYFGIPVNHNDTLRCYVENHDIVGRKPGEPFRLVRGADYPAGLAEPRVDDLVDTALTARAVKFIGENRERPFFLLFAPCAPHTHVTPAGPFRGGSEAGLYGDYVQELDAHVGEILDTLRQHQLAERTLVVFSSDNGGQLKDIPGVGWRLNLASEAGDLRARKATAKADARRLGHLTNGDWRGGKGDIYEGGHRVPMVVRWPGRIATNAISDALVCLTDWLSTTAALLDTNLPSSAGEDSVSFLPVILGPTNTQSARSTLVSQDNQGVYAFRDGPWKLVETAPHPAGTPPELYHLGEDPREQRNRAVELPEVVDRLQEALNRSRNEPATRTSAQVNAPYDPSRWEREIAAFEAADRANPPPAGATLFVGSSTVRMWKTLAEDLPGVTVINRGFGGSEIADATHFADRIIVPCAPTRIVLRAGGNDLARGKSPEQVFGDFQDFVAKVQARLPQTEVVFLSGFPTLRRRAQLAGEQRLNAMIADYCQKQPHLRYLEVWNITLDAAGQTRADLLLPDQLHLNADGYRLLAARVRSFLLEP